ncbi:hypothetical protein [Streptomyces alboflavus]|uniref:hypothetical protein n=1 Tax=Streptomyces alboflavus TaxID=67267 RepID=UPI0004BE716B|nr:hypothetical protein [Streptomyces alboflavus]
MSVYVCSLKTTGPQLIDPGGYQVVRLPYGGGESYDPHGMHPAEQPDGYVVGSWLAEDRAGLIWPAIDGWGELRAMIQWEAGGYTELRDQVVRDPLGMTSDPADTTATDHRPPTPGMQCFTKAWSIFVHPGVPLALRVAHNDAGPRQLVLAELKLIIHPEEG